MKLKNVIFTLILISLSFICINVKAEGEEFKFLEENYKLRGFDDSLVIEMKFPDGYSYEDLENIISSDEEVVLFYEFLGKLYITSIGPGQATIKASFKDYVATAEVTVADSIEFKVIKDKEKDTTILSIDNKDGLSWATDTRQAVEISVRPEGSTKEEKWIRLGEGQFGTALNNTYRYEIKENCIVTVRWISWWTGDYYTGDTEIVRKTIVFDDIEQYDSIGARIIITSPYDIKGRSEVKAGETLQLSVNLVEISDDVKISWRSYHQSIANINESGIVTTIMPGTAMIEATVIENNGNEYKEVYPIIVLDTNQKMI